MGKFMSNAWCNECQWSGAPGVEHECIPPGEPRYATDHRRRLFDLVKDGPGPRILTREDVAALRWASKALDEARHASSKLWSMVVRREVDPKAEIDGLLAAFGERPWWHVGPPPCRCEQCREWDRQRDEDRERRDRERAAAQPATSKP